VAGCDVVRDRRRLKELIGVVFEEQNLYDRLSARMNLQFNCWLYGLPESRIDEVLGLVGLTERAKDAVRTFSNGMKQRLMIVRALLHQPPVLFLDEPTRGLDPIAARDVHATIRQMGLAGTTILLTTHLLEEADQLSQPVAFIVGKRVVATGTPRDLKLAHGKRTVVVVYQLALTGVVLGVMGAYTGHVGLVVLYALLGSCFSLALGLLFGSAFSTMSSVNAAQGLVIFVYVLAGLFVGPLGALIGGNLVGQIARVLPTYYVAEGVYNASQGLESPATNVLDISIILGSTVALLLVSVWLLRRQSAVLATI
jgi:ABC-type Na+ transport system ATPase subunit NatA